MGFIGACVKVRPTKKIADLRPESVVKKLKDKAFARSVDRSHVYGGADALGRPLLEHVAFLIEAPQTHRGRDRSLAATARGGGAAASERVTSRSDQEMRWRIAQRGLTRQRARAP